MATSKDDIRNWLIEAKEKGASHLIVVCDTYDYEDYPVYILPLQKVEEELKQYTQNMQRVMEVYSLKRDIEEQLAEGRAYHVD